MAAASRKGLFLAAFLAVASAAGAQPFLFVTWEQSGQVVVIDTASDPNVLVGAFAAGRSPRHLAFAPNGEFGYVLAEDDGTAVVFDTAERSVVTSVALGGPGGTVAVAPNLGAAYVTLPSSGSVVLVDTRRHEVRRTVPVGGEPFGVAVTPDTKTVLVAGCAPEDGTVGLCFLDTGTADVEAFLPLGGALAVGVRPDGKFAYVSGCQGGTCVVDLGQREVVGSLPGVGEDAVSLAFLRDGSEVFLPTPSGGKLFRVDSRAHEVVAEITGFTAPVCVALGPAGRRAYVTDPDAARVRVVDVPTGNIAGGISTPGRRPYCVAVAPSLCPGDCDGDGAVDTEEFELVTSFLFDTTLLSLCPESDRDADLRVSAHEVVAALLALAEGCAS